MSRSLAVRLALLAVWVGGCASNPHHHGGHLISEYRSGDKVATGSAPYRANYALHGQDGEVVLWRGLAENESIGFARNSEGALLAVAGPDRIPLADAAYCWHVTSETQPSDTSLVLRATGKSIAGVGRFYGQVVLAVVLFPFIVLWKIPVSPFPF